MVSHACSPTVGGGEIRVQKKFRVNVSFSARAARPHKARSQKWRRGILNKEFKENGFWVLGRKDETPRVDAKATWLSAGVQELCAARGFPNPVRVAASEKV